MKPTPATPNQELAQLLMTPTGTRIHELLREIYAGDCFDRDPLEMARKCGNREIVLDCDDLVAERKRKGEQV